MDFTNGWKFREFGSGTNKKDGKTWPPVGRGSVVVQGLLWQYIQGKGHGSVVLVLALVLRCCISGVLPKLASENVCRSTSIKVIKDRSFTKVVTFLRGILNVSFSECDNSLSTELSAQGTTLKYSWLGCYH